MLEYSALLWSSCCCKESSIFRTLAVTGSQAFEIVRTFVETHSVSSSLDGGASLGLLRVFYFSRIYIIILKIEKKKLQALTYININFSFFSSLKDDLYIHLSFQHVGLEL